MDPLDSPIGLLILIHWMVTYPVDSALQLLNNRGQVNTGVENNIFWSEVPPPRIPRAPREGLTEKSSPGFI